MLRIRLQRIGKKKQPVYRFIVSEKTKDTQAGSLEILGQYNPVLKEKLINMNAERIKHWISVGAQPSATVNNILINAGIIEGKKQKSVTITNKRKAKLDKKKEEVEEKKKAAKEAKEAEAVAKKEAEAVAKKEAEEAKAAEIAKAEEAKAEKKEEVKEEKVEEEKTEEPKEEKKES
ncbi:MAG: 30S ribosomal protein S16 [Candidatus Magasanikbacteria bacterium]|nr:30S ribosomal protein S16 [Candidatus Magasanikbacteria bacterium]MBT5819948.1 30S ribosomal protein S16 [Candidatus Magasanikbacteria bacterium]MBT6294138.1 30S ribosomal protein S16 [Candidatus Magasanikbacteria bacterium]